MVNMHQENNWCSLQVPVVVEMSGMTCHDGTCISLNTSMISFDCMFTLDDDTTADKRVWYIYVKIFTLAHLHDD